MRNALWFFLQSVVALAAGWCVMQIQAPRPVWALVVGVGIAAAWITSRLLAALIDGAKRLR